LVEVLEDRHLRPWERILLDEQHRKPLLNATSFIYLNINGRIEVIIINHSINSSKD
jgi:hypothetical protein